jgi:hypothetical protein
LLPQHQNLRLKLGGSLHSAAISGCGSGRNGRFDGLPRKMRRCSGTGGFTMGNLLFAGHFAPVRGGTQKAKQASLSL